MHAFQEIEFDRSMDAASAPPALWDRITAAAAVARLNADAVDLEGRFPTEALDALKAARLLGVMVPARLGGEGASLAQVADLCFLLGRECGSAAMIFAMHQVSVACLVRHHGDNPWQTDFLRRMARDQLLLASSTTEGNAGGAVRKSAAPIETQAGTIRLVRAAGVISYGEQADALVTTARRNPEAAPADQVLAVFERTDCRLERTASWNAMGMRGTCSHGFALEATGRPEQVLTTPYAEIHAQTMTVTAHVLWASVWAGVAAAAVERARLYLRKAARAAPDSRPPGAPHLAEAKASLQALSTLVTGFVARHAEVGDNPAVVSALDYQTTISLLKVQASELAAQTVMRAARVCGLAGYRNEGEVSLSRLLRDVLSAPLMISNDRILADLGAAALLDRGPTTLNGSLGS